MDDTYMTQKMERMQALMQFDSAALGLKLMEVTPEAARKHLASIGADTGDMSDKEALLVYTATISVGRVSSFAGSVARDIALMFGILSSYEAWRDATDSGGKPYPSENAYLKGRFPGYATSTTSLYADVGKTIYLPIMQNKPGYEGLEWLADLSPGNAKFLVSIVKKPKMRLLLANTYQEWKRAHEYGKLSQRDIRDMVKSVKESFNARSPGT